MDRRRIFTVDPDYFPLNRMREIVDYLHSHDQYYGTRSRNYSTKLYMLTQVLRFVVLMTDPAVAYLPGEDYGPYNRGTKMDIWLKTGDGKNYSLGAVWPGTFYAVSAFVAACM